MTAARTTATRFLQSIGICAELHAIRNIGAGHIEFEAGDLGQWIEFPANGYIILDTVAGHVHEHWDAEPWQLRDFLRDESPQAHVGQPDGVEHAGGCFDDAFGRIALPRLAGNALGREGPELGEVRVRRILERVAAGARGG